MLRGEGAAHVSAHRTQGALRVLEWPWVYRLAQNAVGAQRLRRHLVTEMLGCRSGMRMLDIGCGPGDLLEILPREVEYTGLDVNPRYLDRARQRWGARAQFVQGDTGELNQLAREGGFDRITALALLHHLEDAAVADADRGLHQLP